MPPTCQSVTPGQSGTDTLILAVHPAGVVTSAPSQDSVHHVPAWPQLWLRSTGHFDCTSIKPTLEISLMCVCVWCLNTNCLCAKANRFVPDVPDTHPIKPSQPISNLHHKDGILFHFTAQVLHSESPQSRTNYRFTKKGTLCSCLQSCYYQSWSCKICWSRIDFNLPRLRSIAEEYVLSNSAM